MTEFLHDEFFELNPALVLASSSQSRHVSSVLKVGRSGLVSVSLLASLFTIARSFFILFYVNYVYT